MALDIPVEVLLLCSLLGWTRLDSAGLQAPGRQWEGRWTLESFAPCCSSWVTVHNVVDDVTG